MKNGYVKWDQALNQTANRSLDMTIDSLGRDTVERKVDLYRWAQTRVKETCALQATRVHLTEC